MPNENLRFKKIFFCMEMITLGIKNPKCMLILNKMHQKVIVYLALCKFLSLR